MNWKFGFERRETCGPKISSLYVKGDESFPFCQGRFPSNKNHRFKFSEFLLVKCNGSDPEFEVTCSATQGMPGETLLCLKMEDFLKLFAALKQHDCETISCTILYRNEDLILLAAITCFMRRELTRVNQYFEVTIPAYLSGEFENHLRMIKETCQLLTQYWIVHTGRISTDNLSGRQAILPDKQILLFLWSAANKEAYRTIADRPPLLLFQVSTSVHAR